MNDSSPITLDSAIQTEWIELAAAANACTEALRWLRGHPGATLRDLLRRHADWLRWCYLNVRELRQRVSADANGNVLCDACDNCILCSGCSNCSDCSFCSRCSDCSGCSNCSFCSDCSDKKGKQA